MDERRGTQRANVYSRIEVIDNNSKAQLGLLMDISPAGFMINAPQPLPPNTLYQICLMLPDEGTGQPGCRLHIGAEALWAEESPDRSHAWVGFQIIDISDADLAFIEQMIDDWSHPGT